MRSLSGQDIFIISLVGSLSTDAGTTSLFHLVVSDSQPELIVAEFIDSHKFMPRIGNPRVLDFQGSTCVLPKTFVGAARHEEPVRTHVGAPCMPSQVCCGKTCFYFPVLLGPCKNSAFPC